MDRADILHRWSEFQRAIARPEAELTWANCSAELDLDKRTRCLDCGTDCLASGDCYIVHDHVWTATGLGYSDGVLCFARLRRRLGRPLRRDDFPREVPLNRASWAAIRRAVAEGTD